MRLCFVFKELRVANFDHTDAPPTVEVRDPDAPWEPHRIFERLTGTTDPVHGIAFYEEVNR